MSLTDILLILLLVITAYAGTQLIKVVGLLQAISTKPYVQQSAFQPEIAIQKTLKTRVPKSDGRKPNNTGTISIEDMPPDAAIKALTDWDTK